MVRTCKLSLSLPFILPLNGRFAKALVILASFSFGIAYAQTTGEAQTRSTNWPAPDASGKLPGYFDANAVTVLTAFQSAMGGALGDGVVGIGTIVLGGTSQALPASLLKIPEGTQLDIVINGAHRLTSTFSNGVGSYKGKVSERTLTPSQSTSGLAAFDLTYEALKHKDKYVILDHGVYTNSSAQYRRITIGRRFTQVTYQDALFVADMYFDPETNLLRQIVSKITVPESPRNEIVKVETFDNYQKSGLLQFPGTITEELGGIVLWTFTLSHTRPALSSDNAGLGY